MSSQTQSPSASAQTPRQNEHAEGVNERLCCLCSFISLSLSLTHVCLSLPHFTHTHTHTQRGKHDLQAHLFPTPVETAFPALCHCCVQFVLRSATLQQPRFNVVTVFKSPDCTANINALCDTHTCIYPYTHTLSLSLSHPSSSSLSPAVAALTTVAMATEEQARHWGIWRQLGVKTPMLLEPYYWVCACACSSVTVFIVVCLKTL